MTQTALYQLQRVYVIDASAKINCEQRLRFLREIEGKMPTILIKTGRKKLFKMLLNGCVEAIHYTAPLDPKPRY